MRKKRSRSKASGTSVKRTASTQLDVDKLERELLLRDRKAESATLFKKRASLRRIGAKSSDPFSRQIHRPGTRPRAGTSKRFLKIKSGDGTPSKHSVRKSVLGGATAQIGDGNQAQGSSGSSTTCNSVQVTLKDINENAPYSSSGRANSRGRKRGPGRHCSCTSIIKLPFNSVLRVDTATPSRSSCRRSYKCRSPRNRRKSSLKTKGPKGKLSPTVSFLKKRAKPINSSRYQVTPCPTHGSCNSYKSCSTCRSTSSRRSSCRRKHHNYRSGRYSHSYPSRSMNRSCSNSISRRKSPSFSKRANSKTCRSYNRSRACVDHRSGVQAPLYPQHRRRSRSRHKCPRPSERSRVSRSSSGSSSTSSSAVRKASRILKRLTSSTRKRHRRRRSRTGSDCSKEKNRRVTRELSHTLKPSIHHRRSRSSRSRHDYRRGEIKKKQNSLMCVMM